MTRLALQIGLTLLSSLAFYSDAVANSPLEIELLPGKPLFQDAATLVRQSGSIVLADVESLTVHGHVREYSARVIETLKGSVAGTITIRIQDDYPLSAADQQETFILRATLSEGYSHHDISFWLGAAGRPVTLDAAGFSKGAYLLFLDKLHHRYGAEWIIGNKDPWYGTVKAMVADPTLKGRLVEPVAFLKMFGSIYLAKCGTPQTHKYQSGKIWGEDYKLETWRATLRDDHPPDFLDPDFGGRRAPCTVRAGRAFYYLALFVDDYTQFPIAVPIEDGVVRFGQRYGNIVLPARDVPLDALIDELRQ